MCMIDLMIDVIKGTVAIVLLGIEAFLALFIGDRF